MWLVCGFVLAMEVPTICQCSDIATFYLTSPLVSVLQVQREDLYDAFYKLTDSRQQISSYVYDTVRASVPKMDLDNVFESKEEIASRYTAVRQAGTCITPAI